jgi:hypothetical protein
MQTLEDFDYALTYQETMDHANERDWLTGGDRPLSDADIAHNNEMIAAFKQAHGLDGTAEVVPLPTS